MASLAHENPAMRRDGGRHEEQQGNGDLARTFPAPAEFSRRLLPHAAKYPKVVVLISILTHPSRRLAT